MKKTENNLHLLINRALAFSLPEVDAQNARELADYNEYALAFDTVLTQLYEYSIPIDLAFYQLAEKIAVAMHLAEEEYEYLTELLP
jgi:hypothetical protein